MKSKDLINAFINDNFDKKNFQINFIEDVLAILIDEKGNKLSLMAIPSYDDDLNYIISTKVNGVTHLTYRLATDLYGDRIWLIR